MDLSWRVGLPVVLAALLWPSWLPAGVLIVESQEAVYGSQLPKTIRIQTAPNRVRVDITHAGQRRAFILDTGGGALWIVDYTEKVYREVNRDIIDKLQGEQGRTVAVMQGRVNEQLESLPPEQRKEVEAQMQARVSYAREASPPERSQPVFVKTIEQKIEGAWTCDWYESYDQGKKLWEVCAADPLALGLTTEDVRGIEQMGRLLGKFSPQDDFMPVALEEGEDSPYPGLPINRIFYQEDRIQVLFEVTEIQQQETPDAEFEVPAGFEKRNLFLLDGAR